MIKLDIVTPEKKVFSGEVADVYLPTEAGEIGVLETHTAMVTPLLPGELRYAQDGQIHALAIGSGFAEVDQQGATILTDMAISADEVDEAQAEEQKSAAEKALESLDHNEDAEEIAQLKATIGRSVAQLQLKRR